MLQPVLLKIPELQKLRELQIKFNIIAKSTRIAQKIYHFCKNQPGLQRNFTICANSAEIKSSIVIVQICGMTKKISRLFLQKC